MARVWLLNRNRVTASAAASVFGGALTVCVATDPQRELQTHKEYIETLESGCAAPGS